MKDVLLFVTVFLIGYLCFIGIVFGLLKLFFPFFTKEEIEQRSDLLKLIKNKFLMTRVLVVDDELDICMMVCTHLQKLQFHTEYALSVKDAIAKVDSNEYQLLFTDIGLTDGTGFDVINHLQKTSSTMKIVVISAYSNEASKGLEMGADLFIAKPFSVKIINRALQTLDLIPIS
jgi:CheY-like chemotaxis protein